MTAPTEAGGLVQEGCNQSAGWKEGWDIESLAVIRVYDRAPMLPRLVPTAIAPAPGPRRVCRYRRQRSDARWPCQPADPALSRWLHAPGSLTARLRTHGRVDVTVLSQGTQRLWPAERQALRCRSGHVREVVLSLDGTPVVWARSVTSHRALKGPWRAVKGLGSRPLAELLFSHARVRRGRLALHPRRRRGPEHQRARRHWPASAHQAPPGWARASVFTHHGQALRVMESFAPWARHLRTF